MIRVNNKNIYNQNHDNQINQANHSSDNQAKS